MKSLSGSLALGPTVTWKLNDKEHAVMQEETRDLGRSRVFDYIRIWSCRRDPRVLMVVVRESNAQRDYTQY